MSYQVSARKWRPQVFEEVVGQKHIITTLTNAIANNRISSAYIFSGTRGVGKTTTARILSKAMNCNDGPTITPCCKCSSCIDIKTGNSIDVIEIDGASNRGIDDIRTLRESVHYAPSGGKSKIYIIDEVHMLTKEAFNALLKTLEEPPKQVIFIFATTEINKVPDTIMSRCQWFDFKSLTIDDISKQLKFIAQNESIKITKEQLYLISKSAQGSMRDGEMLFDQVVSFGGKQITDENLRNVLGLADKKLTEGLIESIAKKDTAAIVESISSLRECGCDISVFQKELIEYTRNMMIAKTVKDVSEKFIKTSPSEIECIKNNSKKFTVDQLHRIFNILLDTGRDIKTSSYPEIILEMAIIKATQAAPCVPIDSIIEKIEYIQRNIPAINTRNTPLSLKKETIKEPIFEKKTLPPSLNNQTLEKQSQEKQKTEEKAKVQTNSEDQNPYWKNIIDEVGIKKPILPSMLENGKLLSLDKDISLGFDETQAFYTDIIQKKENKNLIEKTAEKITGKTLNLRIVKLVSKKKDEVKTEDKIPSNITDDTTKELITDALDIFKGNLI